MDSNKCEVPLSNRVPHPLYHEGRANISSRFIWK
jgi:hypothetical protein